MNVTLAIEVFVTLLVIMDPVGTVPIFLSLVSGRPQSAARAAAWQAVSVSLGVIVVFALFGQAILDYLGITLPAMQCAGGLLLLLVALELLMSNEHKRPEAGETNVALVPLGTPLMAGPGAIVATMLFTRRVHEVSDGAGIAAGILGVHLLLWLVMRYSLPILALLRDSGVLLITKISGVLLSAIAVQMVADSVRAFIRG